MVSFAAPAEASLPPLPSENTYSDNDGWSDFQELMFGTDNASDDTDGDGVLDNEDRDPLTDVSLEILESAPPELDSENIRNAVDVWPQLFENAEKSIYLETYYIADSVPAEIVNALKNAASGSVDVKIILDEGMYATNSSKPNELNSHDNIEVRTLQVKTMSGGWLHAKYFIIDNEVAYIGSQNWSWTALNDSLEVGVLVRSRALCGALLSIFEADWIESGGEPLTPEQPNDSDNDRWPDEYEGWLGTDLTSADTDNDGISDSRDPNPFVPLDTLVTGASVKRFYLAETAPTIDLDNPHVPNTENVLRELIGSASEDIRAQLYQYSTAGGYTVLDNALRMAAARGVNVKVLVDNKFGEETWGAEVRETLESLGDVGNIEVKVINIKEIGLSSSYGWVHTKVLSIDGERAYVGSANWFAPHMGHEITIGGWQPGPTRDVGLVFESPGTVAVLGDIFTRDWTSEYAAPIAKAEGPPSKLLEWALVICGVTVAVIAALLALRRRRAKPEMRRPAPEGIEKWYVHQDGKRYGPVDAELLRRWISEGRVSGDALVWRKGMEKWQKVSETEEFRSRSRGAPGDR